MNIKVKFPSEEVRAKAERFMAIVGSGSYGRPDLLTLEYNVNPLKFPLFLDMLRRPLCQLDMERTTLEVDGQVPQKLG